MQAATVAKLMWNVHNSSSGSSDSSAAKAATAATAAAAASCCIGRWNERRSVRVMYVIYGSSSSSSRTLLGLSVAGSCSS